MTTKWKCHDALGMERKLFICLSGGRGLLNYVEARV